MKAREVMTAKPEVVTRSDSIRKAAEIMRERDVGLVPIVDDRTSMKVKGVITDRDLAIRHVAAGHTHECVVDEHMTGRPLETVDANADLTEVLAVMKRAQLRRIPVVEGEGRIVGVIAQTDIALKDAPQQPEQLAEIIAQISTPRGPQR